MERAISPGTWIEALRGRFPGRRGPARPFRRVVAGLAGLTFVVLAQAAHAERRLALVIGNAAYEHAPMLRNPLQDAAEVSAMLRHLDFDVTVVTDADKIAMEAAIRRFSASLQDADVALFYYSGHAFQIADRNYLVPTSAAISGPRNLDLDTFALQDVRAAMRRGGAKIQLLFLDACRDNPFGEALGGGPGTSLTRGLAPIEVPTGSLVVFSTSPGQAALDGSGRLSPFTGAFTRYGPQPKLEIRQVLTRVRSEVSEVTDNRQIPWDDSSLTTDFYLVPLKAPPVFDHAMRVTLSAEARGQPLKLTAPVQPEGGAIKITITRLPDAGHLTVAGRVVAAQETLTPDQFAGLGYAPTSMDGADTFVFKVEDAWGNAELGTVSLARDRPAAPVATAGAADPARRPPAQPVSIAAASLVGLGPNLVFKSQAPGFAAGERIELAADLPFGQLVLGERIIEQGRMIDAADLQRVAFIPPLGSAGKHVEAVFDRVGSPSGPVRVAIDVAMTDCDRLAGDRLDAQGASEGVLTGQIDTTAALPACLTAVNARPNLGRFAYQLGRVYAALAKNDEALTAYRKAAELGHTRAVWALGNHAEYTQPPNFAQGKAELELAAAAGDVYAMHSLGLVYAEGRGVPKDLEKARTLFESAARVGHTFSMNSLGSMYQTGEGEPVDPGMARRYWDESAKRGDMYGINDLGIADLDGVGSPPDPAKAMALFKQASGLGHPEAPNNIGRLYVLGLGVPVDFAEARKWDLIGADRGDAWASYNLGELNRLGRGGSTDTAAAGYFYARAAASTNRLEPSQLGRTALFGLDHGAKVGALRRLVTDLEPTAAVPTAEGPLLSFAGDAVSRRHATPADPSLDSLMIAAAQAVWLARNARTDLF